MAVINRRLGPPESERHLWTGAVGADTTLVEMWGNMAARAVIVGVVGTLVLVDINGTTRTYTSAEILAAGNIIRGQWIQVTAAGSTAHTLVIWW